MCYYQITTIIRGRVCTLVHIYLHVEPTEFDVHVLDQITIANISDQEALDDFLNSTDDETTGSSPQSGTPSLVVNITKLIHDNKYEKIRSSERDK